MKPEHPEMQSLQAQIDELDTPDRARSLADDVGGRNNTLLAEYRGALAAEQALQAEVAGLKGQVLNLRGRSIQYTILQREVDTNRSLYDALLQRYKEIGVAGGIGIAPVSIVDRADTPAFPYKPNLLLNLLVGLGRSACSPASARAIGARILQRHDQDPRGRAQQARAGLPRGGAEDAGARTSFVEDLKNPTSIVVRSLFGDRRGASLQHRERACPRCCSSPAPARAKANRRRALALAQNFARRGKTVLLIDSDLRKPAFKAERDNIGLSKLLTNDDRLDGACLSRPSTRICRCCRAARSRPIRPTCCRPAHVARSSPRSAEHFDLVIIDGPPTLGLADAPLLAAAAGNVVFVVEAAQTRTRAAIEALNRLEATGAHVLGVILTKSGERRRQATATAMATVTAMAMATAMARGARSKSAPRS